jgi:hypothetical protein
MFGDDSKLRLRRQTGSILPQHYNQDPSGQTNASTNTNTYTYSNFSCTSSASYNGNTNTANAKGGGKRRVRRSGHQKRRCERYTRLCLSALCAAVIWTSLSILLLPFSWTQVDYHHQVQKAATHLLQVVEDNRHNYQTSIRGKHNQHRQIVCSDGTIGFENDDYCDCLTDGRDESQTSACSFLTVQQPTFVCKQGGATIYASRVHDGIPDCPDGSDEQPPSSP